MKKILILLIAIIGLNQLFAMEKDVEITTEHKLKDFPNWSELPEEIKVEVLKSAILDLIKDRKSGNDLKQHIISLKTVNKNFESALDKTFSGKYILDIADNINANSTEIISPYALGQILLRKELFNAFVEFLKNAGGNFLKLMNQEFKLLRGFQATEDKLKPIILCGVNLNENIFNSTLLDWAAKFGDIKLVKTLINSGINLNIQDRDGRTPLMNASLSGNLDIVRMFIDAGADINIKDGHGLTAVLLAVFFLYMDVAKALIDVGAELNHNHLPESRKALFFAIAHGDLQMIKLFFNTGAELNVQNSYSGETPLMITITSEKPFEIIKFLIDAGSTLNIQDRYGQTALMHAVIKKNVNIVRELIAAGADPNIKDYNGKSAYDHACENNQVEIQELLEPYASWQEMNFNMRNKSCVIS